ncbi:MAG: RsmE family RNA methyltransferase [Oscillospiraceae bacterium]
MPRFFCNEIYENEAHIVGDDAKHISKVLRMREGEPLTINDMQGFDYDCEVLELGEVVKLHILRKYKNETEPSVKITLYQCLPKGDKLDFIIQKAVELGVCTIVPVASKFCVAKADKDTFEKKLLRYNKIAFEAAKQSGRGIIPEVLSIISFRDAVLRAKNTNSIIFYEHGGERVCNLVSEDVKEVSMFIGSEGGFCEDEVQLALQNGIAAATLGKLILRCETAPIAGLALVLSSTENM